jgi:small-conductance mechanosensitive channel
VSTIYLCLAEELVSATKGGISELTADFSFDFMNILNPKDDKKKKHNRESHTRYAPWIWSYVTLGMISFLMYFLLDYHVFTVFGRYLLHLKKLSLGVGLAAIILTVSRFIEQGIAKRSQAATAQYNLIRFIRLLAVFIIMLMSISLLFENWYTAAVSLGLISLLVGFALQTPITSLIGWIYIVLRTPYHVGDRIQIDEFTGDVVEINYLDTTLWEFGGEYLTNDLPSGRLIRFPNSLIRTWKKRLPN